MNFTIIDDKDIEYWFSDGTSELIYPMIKEMMSDVAGGLSSGKLMRDGKPVGYWRTLENDLNNGMFCQHGGDVDQCIVCNPETGDPYEW